MRHVVILIVISLISTISLAADIDDLREKYIQEFVHCNVK